MQKGEKGPPRLTPLLQEKKPCCLPLTKNDSFGEWRIVWSHLHHTLLNPKAFNSLNKKSQFKVSKALEILILRARLSP
jgi:hypothetical protein